jgi:hypothetical protein
MRGKKPTLESVGEDMKRGGQKLENAVKATEMTLGAGALLGVGYGIYKLFGGGKSKPKPTKTLGSK